VRAARSAFGGWARATAYNRGQILYRIAEMLEGRREQFVGYDIAPSTVDEAIDRWVWYAGWADKLAAVYGGANPVAGPYFNFTVPEPTGVVGILAPGEPALLGLVSRLAPVLAGGNCAVVVASEAHPRAAIELAEVLATSDVPGGVVNLLTGRRDELAPHLASHLDIDALDLPGGDAELERAAADNVKRVVFSRPGQSLYEISSFLEFKTVWHPMGQ
jgi:acyl-CoA reductase-like NAD-dependent aldehyde dehydrogenase